MKQGTERSWDQEKQLHPAQSVIQSKHGIWCGVMSKKNGDAELSEGKKSRGEMVEAGSVGVQGLRVNMMEVAKKRGSKMYTGGGKLQKGG